MFFFWLPKKETQRARWSDYLIAAFAAHFLGIVIVPALNLSVFHMFGVQLTEGLSLAHIWTITNVPLVPITTLLGMLCGRVGLLGFGASLVAGMAIGATAGTAWAMMFAPYGPRHLDEFVFLGICYGIPASTFYWLALRFRRPEVFINDPLAQSLWGISLYIFSAVVLIGFFSAALAHV